MHLNTEDKIMSHTSLDFRGSFSYKRRLTTLVHELRIGLNLFNSIGTP
jgi:hypothetical protein